MMLNVEVDGDVGGPGLLWTNLRFVIHWPAMPGNFQGLQAPSRIHAIDWLRGLAVLLMIQTHGLTLLRPELRAGSLFNALQWVDGLVAPSFILAAGFSMALTQVRAALSAGAADARRRRMRKTLRRLAEVLLVGTLVNWMWFPIFREPRWILRMDILQCIGLSLVIALPILFALAPRPRALRWTALLLSAVAFGVAPLPRPWARPGRGSSTNARTRCSRSCLGQATCTSAPPSGRRRRRRGRAVRRSGWQGWREPAS